MTQAEKIAEEWLKEEEEYYTDGRNVRLTELIQRVAERTRKEILKKNAKGIDENTGEIWESEIVHVKDIPNAKWEDESIS